MVYLAADSARRLANSMNPGWSRSASTRVKSVLSFFFSEMRDGVVRFSSITFCCLHSTQAVFFLAEDDGLFCGPASSISMALDAQ